MRVTCNGYGASVGKVTPNRDAFFCNPIKGMFGVFDGVGDEYNTEKASREAARLFSNSADNLGSMDRDDQFVGPWLCEQTLANHGQIKFTYSAETTATVMVVCANIDEPNICVMNIGDSRIYGFNKGRGILSKLSVDDSFVLDYPHFDDVETKEQLSDSELAIFKNSRHIIQRAIGGINLGEVETQSYPIENYGAFLLTTDGIHDNLTTKEILDILMTPNASEETIVNNLIQAARDRSNLLSHLRSKHDDCTAVYVTIELEG